jgi:phage shock protein E
MIETIKRLFQNEPPIDFRRMKEEGAVIIDVRSKREFEGGHIEGAVNIPLDQLTQNPKRLPEKSKAIILCCASGMRSATATDILRRLGYKNVFNGGGWTSLQNKI